MDVPSPPTAGWLTHDCQYSHQLALQYCRAAATPGAGDAASLPPWRSAIATGFSMVCCWVTGSCVLFWGNSVICVGADMMVDAGRRVTAD